MKLLTQNAKTEQAKLFKTSVEDSTQMYYVFGSRAIPWDDEGMPPAPTQDIQSSEYDIYDNLVFGKRLNSDSIALMVKRNDWIYNTVYDYFDSTVSDLATKEYFVTVESVGAYHIFLCLDNNNGTPSIYPPAFEDTSPDETFYFTADGYHWKYLFSIDDTTFERFATTTHIPFVENQTVTANAVAGAIESVVIVNRGNNYNSYANGFFQEIAVNGNNTVLTIEPTSSANTDFYRGSAVKIVQGPGSGQQRTITEYVVAGGQKRVVLDRAYTVMPTLSSKYEITPRVAIDGDGFDCHARALINPSTNTISYIEVSNTGFGYSYANATVVGNSGIIIGNTGFEEAQLRVVLGPPKGFGGDVPKTLLCDTVGISSTFANTELGTIPTDNKIRQIGLLKNPLFANVELAITNIAGTFVDGENVVDGTTGASGVVTFYSEASALIRLADVMGVFEANNVVTGGTSNATATTSTVSISGFDKTFDTFDQRLRMNITLNTPQEFAENDKILQRQTFANAYIESANTTIVGVTKIRGTFNISDINDDFSITGTNGASANVNAIVYPDLKKNSGEILYVENVEPIQRSPTTSETIKLNVSFATK